MSLTEFGKVVRKIRIDKDMSLKDMAEIMGVSSAYISAMETGRKQLSSDFVMSASDALRVNDQQRKLLVNAASTSLQDVRVRVSPDSMALVMAFARKIESGDMDFEALERILDK